MAYGGYGVGAGMVGYGGGAIAGKFLNLMLTEKHWQKLYFCKFHTNAHFLKHKLYRRH